MAYLIALYTIDRGIPTRRAFFGEGRGPVHLSRAGCTSKDTDLLRVQSMDVIIAKMQE